MLINYTIAGIDQSLSNTGLCILKPSGPLYYNIKPNKITGVTRLAYIRDSLQERLKDHKVTLAMVEGYSYESTNQSFMLGEIGGVIKLMLHDLKIQTYTVAPSSLKKFVTGNGSSDKSSIMAKYVLTDNNIADARGLAEVGKSLVTKSWGTRYELEVIRTLLNNPENLHVKKK